MCRFEHRLPLDTTAPGNDDALAAPDASFSSKRTNNVITKDMAEDIWACFVRHLSRNGNIGSVAADVHAATGMNQNSAPLSTQSARWRLADALRMDSLTSTWMIVFPMPM